MLAIMGDVEATESGRQMMQLVYSLLASLINLDDLILNVFQSVLTKKK